MLPIDIIRFSGIGVAWTVAAIVNAVRGKPFTIQPGSLAFSVTLYIGFAITAIILLLIRRSPRVGKWG